MNPVAMMIMFSVISFQQSVPAAANPSARDLPETKVVLRISREFIHELTAKQFKRDVPIDMDFGGTKVEGQAHATGITTVEIQASENSCNFELVVKGEVSTELTATGRSVQSRLHGLAPFAGRRRIVFNDDTFSGQSASVETSYHSTVDRICSFRSG